MACVPILVNSQTHEIYNVEPECTIGRGLSCSITLLSSYVSRHQCKITLDSESNSWILIDLSSFKTTLLNEAPIDSVHKVLKDGDIISFAHYKDVVFKFYSTPESLEEFKSKSLKRRHNGEECMCTQAPPTKTLALSASYTHSALPGDHAPCTVDSQVVKKLEDKVDYLTTALSNVNQGLTSDNEKLTSEVQNTNLSNTLKEDLGRCEEEISRLKSQLDECEVELERVLSECTCRSRVSASEPVVTKSVEEIVEETSPEVQPEPEPEPEACSSKNEFTPWLTVSEPSPENPPVDIDDLINNIPDFSKDALPSSDAPTDLKPDLVDREVQTTPEKPEDTLDLDQIVGGVEKDLLLQEVDALKEQVAQYQLMLESKNMASEAVASSLKDVIETELTCGVCSDIFYKPVFLNCKHAFCSHCLEEWKKKKRECPVCRAKIVTEVPPLMVDNLVDKLVDIVGGDLKAKREESKQDGERRAAQSKAVSRRGGRRGTAGTRRGRRLDDLNDMLNFVHFLGLGEPSSPRGVPTPWNPAIQPMLVDLTVDESPSHYQPPGGRGRRQTRNRR